MEWSPMGGRLAEDRPSRWWSRRTRSPEVLTATRGEKDQTRSATIPACLPAFASTTVSFAHTSTLHTAQHPNLALILFQPSSLPHLARTLLIRPLAARPGRSAPSRTHHYQYIQIICHTQQGAKCGWRTPKRRANMSIIRQICLLYGSNEFRRRRPLSLLKSR